MSSAPTTADPARLRTVADRVESRLTDLLDGECSRWARVDPDLVAPVDTLAGLVLGSGKRLRPAFCYWSFVGAGGDPDDPRIVDAGAAFELLQAFAVIHDDVMDGSPSRRGARTAHLTYADHHGRAGWLGEARRFGEGVAILIGNMAHVLADQLVRDATRGAGLAVWDELRLELNMGQYLDMVGTARHDTEIDRARLVARYKSGKYTVERPLHVGAALAGRGEESFGALSRYGDPVGEVFQLRDDLLDIFGDAALTGKPIGADLREGKPTTLLAAAVARCPPTEADLLARVGASDLSAHEVARIGALMESCGARAEIETLIATLTERAIAALASVPITDAARDALVELARFVATRDH